MSTQTPDSSELTQQKNDIIVSVANDYYDSLKNESKLLNMSFEDSREYVLKLATEDVDELIETAVQQASKALLGLLEDKLLDKAITLTNEDTAVLWDDIVDILERQQPGKDGNNG